MIKKDSKVFDLIKAGKWFENCHAVRIFDNIIITIQKHQNKI